MHFVPAYLLVVLYAVTGMAVAVPASGPEPVPEPAEEGQLQSRELHGRGTIYQQLGAYGSCEWKHNDGDLIVALGNHWMKHQHKSPYCGRMIRARNKETGITLHVKVADTCMACGPNDLDFSVGAWDTLTRHKPWGVFPVAWDWA